MRVAEGTPPELVDEAVRVVQLLNMALPRDWQIGFGEEPGPAGTADPGPFEIIIAFAAQEGWPAEVRPPEREGEDIGLAQPRYEPYATGDPDKPFNLEITGGRIWVDPTRTEGDERLGVIAHEIIHVLGRGHPEPSRFPDSNMVAGGGDGPTEHILHPPRPRRPARGLQPRRAQRDRHRARTVGGHLHASIRRTRPLRGGGRVRRRVLERSRTALGRGPGAGHRTRGEPAPGRHRALVRASPRPDPHERSCRRVRRSRRSPRIPGRRPELRRTGVLIRRHRARRRRLGIDMAGRRSRLRRRGAGQHLRPDRRRRRSGDRCVLRARPRGHGRGHRARGPLGRVRRHALIRPIDAGDRVPMESAATRRPGRPETAQSGTRLYCGIGPTSSAGSTRRPNRLIRQSR